MIASGDCLYALEHSNVRRYTILTDIGLPGSLFFLVAVRYATINVRA